MSNTKEKNMKVWVFNHSMYESCLLDWLVSQEATDAQRSQVIAAFSDFLNSEQAKKMRMETKNGKEHPKAEADTETSLTF